MDTLLRLSFRALLGCALLLTLPACDSGSDDDDDGGGGGGGGGGGISLDGSAYAIDAEIAGGGFALYLFDQTVAFEDFDDGYTGDFLFMLVESQTPGTYDVGTFTGEVVATYGVYGEDVTIAGEDDPEDFDNAFASTSGSITISSANAAQVRGSYDLQMIGAGGTRTLRGTFTAQIVEPDGDDGDGGGNGGGDVDRGSFTAVTSGGFSLSYEGHASAVQLDGSEVATISLINGDYPGASTDQVITFAGSDLPRWPLTSAVYSVSDSPETGDFGVAFLAVDGSTVYSIESPTGNLTISEITDDRISGTFGFEGMGLVNGEEVGTVTVSGLFEGYDY